MTSPFASLIENLTLLLLGSVTVILNEKSLVLSTLLLLLIMFFVTLSVLLRVLVPVRIASPFSYVSIPSMSIGFSVSDVNT